MDKKTLIAVGAGVAVALGALAYFVLTPSSEELAAQETAAPAPAKAAPASEAPKQAAPAVSAKPIEKPAAAPAAAPAPAASGSGSTGIEKEKLKAILEEMITKLSNMQSKLQSRIADFFHAAEGDQNVAMQMYQAAVAESLQAIETEVQKTYSVTQRELMAAQQEHKNDAEVKALMTHLKQLFFGEDAEEMAPDPDTIEVPEGMTADIFYEKFSRHVDIVEGSFRLAIAEAKANAPKEDRMAYMQMLMMRKLEEVNASAIAEVGLSEEDFQKCLMKFQTDPRFFEKITESQSSQEKLRDELMED